MKIKTPEDPPIRYVTPDEIQAILAAADQEPDSQWWRTFLTVLYAAGLRLGEASSLCWSDLDFDKDEIRVSAKKATDRTLEWSPKTPKSLRSIPVPSETMTLLAKLQNDAIVGHPYVFVAPERVELMKAAKERGWDGEAAVLRGPQARFPDIVLRAAQKVKTLTTWIKAEGGELVPDKATVSFHDLRRSAITNWAAVVPMPVVMALAGHSSILTTSRFYATTTKAQLDLARQASGAAVTPAVAVGSTDSARE